MPARLTLLILALSASLLSSCSLGYQSDWNKAAARDTQNPPKDLTGAWEGLWYSRHNGHHGKLKAIVTPVEEQGKNTAYDFRYHATWARVLSGGYTARHLVDRRGRVTGQQDLGALVGGVYHYEGKATPAEFKATYRCNIDNGVFELQRPASPKREK
ncbi:hypothetical protein [Verrucomicrobium spinosum]|uniref:hypothetical protein n=1 Tax=Verrucomicrobium spinosum TaxID=2736 RepID=UPI0001744E12|nr:hypothetical protein [Verrucomicrobium spinosum]